VFHWNEADWAHLMAGYRARLTSPGWGSPI
jgi:hypothetical protein